MNEPNKTQQINDAIIAQCADNFELFLHTLKIPSSMGPITFSANVTPFQEETFRAVAPALEAVRTGTMPKRRRFWVERTKKASKDGDIALMLLWQLAFAVRPVYIQVGAADRDQAGIVKKRMKDTMFYNEWLNDLVDIQQYHARHKGGLCEMDLLPADASTAHGGTPDLMIINELSHIHDHKWDFAETMMDNAAGVPYGVVIIATNAGFKGTNAEIWRQNAIESPDWDAFILDKPSPWINESDLRDAKKRNSKSRYARLWLGQWTLQGGENFDEQDIDYAFNRGAHELSEPEDDWVYLGGLDLGVSNDHSAFVIMGCNVEKQELKMAYAKRWKPRRDTGEIDLMEIEDTVAELYDRFRLMGVWFDPFQAKLMAQRLKKQGYRMVDYSFTGKHLNLMAEAYKQVLEGRKIALYDNYEIELEKDLSKLQIVEKAYGYRLEATRDAQGHADVATALVLTLPTAVDYVGIDWNAYQLRDDDPLIMDAGAPLTKEELEDAPEDLRQIMEDADDIGVNWHDDKRFNFDF